MSFHAVRYTCITYYVYEEEGNCLLFSKMLFKYCWIKLIVLEIFPSSNRIVGADFLYQDHLVCYEYLVSGTKYNVPDEQLNASSHYDTRHAAKWGRLNTVYVKDKHIGGWAADNNTPPHYIQVRFNELSIIQAIATQGRNITGDFATTENYVTKYLVYYRLDDTRRWAAVRGRDGQEPKVFQGNNDSNSIRTNKLPWAVQARAVRILVNDSQGYPSMRFDVLGCPVSQEREKDNKTPEVLVGVAVGVGVLSLSVLIVIGIYVGRRRPFRSSAASTSIKTDLNMTLSNEMSIDTVQEYANVMSGKSESVSPDPSTYDNNQGVQSTHQNRLIKEERVHAVVSTPTRKIAQYTQKEQIYDHLDTGEKVPKLDDETYDHVKK